MRRPTETGWRVVGHSNSSGFMAGILVTGSDNAVEQNRTFRLKSIDQGSVTSNQDNQTDHWSLVTDSSGGALPVDHRGDPYPGHLVEAHPVGLPPLFPQLEGDGRGL